MHNFDRRKNSPKFGVHIYAMLKKLTKVYNNPIGENSSILVTLSWDHKTNVGSFKGSILTKKETRLYVGFVAPSPN
jgi:hypothetical protein